MHEKIVLFVRIKYKGLKINPPHLFSFQPGIMVD